MAYAADVFYNHTPFAARLFEFAAAEIGRSESDEAVERCTLIKRTVGFGDEIQRHAALFQRDLFRTQLPAAATQRYDG